ncbi:glycosyltransferase family 2 protein [uncultured Sulfitobacter sp.]|uniref:glycosyltransferase family 2 protein n=1 Tax=uncultured Sulfitobacter sp. TaxID=191468 RepID=UPI0026317C52|nr:glycosyltransferase family 2 protein [uncultured Sulfitobacter sp.]
MSDRGVTWGLSATILAPAQDILAFAAYHLDAGAHRLYLYLDAPCPEAMAHLQAHPKVRVTLCDAAHWQKVNGGRPAKHQVRQTVNATHAYNRRAEVDWLIHMDVDEFLVSDRPVAAHLAGLPADVPILRVRPMEQLSGDGTVFKGFIPADGQRAAIVRTLYPRFGAHLKGGFLSHLAGKVFTRTGLDDVTVKIHNAFQDGVELKGADVVAGLDLAHCHAKSWDDWHAAYRYRLEKGAYRAELGPNKPRNQGGMSLHEVFAAIEAKDGTAGLRAFFDEVCADTPSLREKLEAKGLLRRINLDLNATLSTHFPNWRG